MPDSATPRPSSRVVNFRRPPEHHWHLGVVAKRTYRIDGARCVPAPDQIPLIEAADAQPGGLDYRDKDTYPCKPVTDIIVHGAAHAVDHEVVDLIASVEIGEVTRRVRVHGDRRVEAVRGGVAVFSKPAPFHAMPLLYERSYGGFDEHAARTQGDGLAELAASFGADFAGASRFTYPRNARGVGFLIAMEVERHTGAPVPNLEDPDDPVLPERLLCEDPDRWSEHPIPGALDGVVPSDFPRSVFFHIDADIPEGSPLPREIALGALTLEDLDPGELTDPPGERAATCAAPGLARVRLVGDEPVRLVHLHPRLRDLAFRLPADRPAIRIGPPGCPMLDLEPQLDTVHLEPDRERVSLVWTGSLRVACRYPEEDFSQVKHEVRWR